MPARGKKQQVVANLREVEEINSQWGREQGKKVGLVDLDCEKQQEILTRE